MSGELVETEAFSMEPHTLEEAMKYAELIANSTLVPNDYRKQPGNVLIAIQMGREIGLKPLQALQHIAVISGRPCVWGDAVPGLIQGSGKLEDCREDFDEKTMTATCSMKRKGQPTPIIRAFSMDDAKKAGLWTKAGTWQTYPKRMLQMRARGWAARDGFADVLKGLSIVEEQMDVEPEEPTALPAPPEPPKRLSQAVESEWKYVQTTKDGVCGVCKEKIPAGSKAAYSVKKGGLRCLSCDPLAVPPDAPAPEATG